MGWRGTLRSIRAASRAAERDARRRQKELERQQKEYERLAEREQAALEVERYNNYVEVLCSIHKDHGPRVSWKTMARAAEPPPPVRSDAGEQEAQRIEAEYSPGILDRMLGREETKRAQLAADVEQARGADEAAYQRAHQDWRAAHEDWKDTKAIAERVLIGEPKALLEAIEVVDPFSEIGELGTRLRFRMEQPDLLEAEIEVHSDTVVPKEAKSLLRSGKLSVKAMPKGKFNELFQDYVCSCVLRVANELFRILPIERVIVTARDTLLNPATGHLEEAPIVSVLVPRATLQRLNLQNIDPSDSMQNFLHRMSFKKAKGFEPVEALSPEDCPA